VSERNSRRAMIATAALVVVIAWFAWGRPSARPSGPPTPTPTATSGTVPIAVSPPPPVFAVATIKVRGNDQLVNAYQEPGDRLCLELPTEGTPYCDIAPGPGPLRLVHANWVYPGSACCGFAMFVIGTIGPTVDSVRVSLGAGRWVRAMIVGLPSSLRAGGLIRLFYIDQPTGMQSLNHRLPIVALDDHGHEIGRTTYLVLGG
jgi:hypothetical protein